MKILLINNGDGDYLSNVILHGGRSLFGQDFIELVKPEFMYKGDKLNLQGIYGRGFTLYGLLDNIEIDRSEIYYKICNNYFDLIIYASVHRDVSYLNEVLTYYPKEKIIFIDGEDGTNLHQILVGKGLYFKRELIQELKEVFPINFGIPKEHIVQSPPDKTKLLANLIPGVPRYTIQEEYYKEYQNSVFGITHKKGGWDCMRHYEILMNGCIPHFINLGDLPIHTMANFPSSFLYNLGSVTLENYKEPVEFLLEHTRKYLTTEAVFKMILDKL